MSLRLMAFFAETISRIIDGAYVTNLEEKQSKGTCRFSLFYKNTAVHFDSFANKYILQEALGKIKDK